MLNPAPAWIFQALTFAWQAAWACLPAAQDLRVGSWGCYGAFPGLLRAREAAVARPGSAALVLAVEICSLHFQPGDYSIENIVSSALFADGASAVLVTDRGGGLPGPALVDRPRIVITKPSIIWLFT